MFAGRTWFAFTVILAAWLFCAVAADGAELVGHWSFEEGAGETVRDSARGNHGNVRGADWIEGKTGKALKFDGESGRVEIGHDDVLNPGDESMMLDIRFKLDELPGWGGRADGMAERRMLLSKRSGGGWGRENCPGYFIFLQEETVAVLLQDTAGNHVYALKTYHGGWETGVWYDVRVVISRKGEHNLGVFVNGNIIGVRPIPGLGPISNEVPVQIAGSRQGSSPKISVDEVRIWRGLARL